MKPAAGVKMAARQTPRKAAELFANTISEPILFRLEDLDGAITRISELVGATGEDSMAPHPDDTGDTGDTGGGPEVGPERARLAPGAAPRFHTRAHTPRHQQARDETRRYRKGTLGAHQGVIAAPRALFFVFL